MFAQPTGTQWSVNRADPLGANLALCPVLNGQAGPIMDAATRGFWTPYVQPSSGNRTDLIWTKDPIYGNVVSCSAASPALDYDLPPTLWGQLPEYAYSHVFKMTKQGYIADGNDMPNVTIYPNPLQGYYMNTFRDTNNVVHLVHVPLIPGVWCTATACLKANGDAIFYKYGVQVYSSLANGIKASPGNSWAHAGQSRETRMTLFYADAYAGTQRISAFGGEYAHFSLWTLCPSAADVAAHAANPYRALVSSVL